MATRIICYLISKLFNCFYSEPTDATQFTVAGRLASKPPVQLQFHKNDIKMPKVTLRSLHQPVLGLAKSPSSMVVTTDASGLTTNVAFMRSCSVPGPTSASDNEENEDENANFAKDTKITVSVAPALVHQGSKVVVHRVDDDETFSSFFKSTISVRTQSIADGVEIADFDAIKSTQR